MRTSGTTGNRDRAGRYDSILNVECTRPSIRFEHSAFLIRAPALNRNPREYRRIHATPKGLSLPYWNPRK
jgi:hypothetical protein